MNPVSLNKTKNLCYPLLPHESFRVVRQNRPTALSGQTD